MKALEEYRSTIKELKDATKDKNISWQRINPTTFLFKTRDEKGHVLTLTIQKITSNTATSYSSKYVLNLKNNSSNENILNIDSKSDSTVRNLLISLYEEVEYAVETEGLSVLKNIIGNKSDS